MTEPSLEDRLRRYGDVLERELVNPQLPASPDRSPKALVIVAAAGLLVATVSVATLVVSNDGRRTETIAAAPTTTENVLDVTESATTSPTSPTTVAATVESVDTETFLGTEGCIAHSERIIAELTDEGQQFSPAPFELEEVVLLPVTGRSGTVRVLLLGKGGGFTCLMRGTATNTVSDWGMFNTDPFVLPDPDSLLVIDGGWTSATDEQVGPGSFEFLGRSGPEVVSLYVELPDGSILPGIVTGDGWFTVAGSIPAGVPIFQERLIWTLTDGSKKSGLHGDLDMPTEAEECANESGCVEARLRELVEAARTSDDDGQYLALQDGIIDQEEQDSAHQRFADCLTGNGLNVTYHDNGGVSVEGPLTDSNAEIRKTCAEEYTTLIEEAADLQYARNQIQE